VKFRLDEAEKQGLAERAARAGKSLHDYLAGLVAADEQVQESADPVRVRETIRKGIVEHAMDDPAPPFSAAGGPGRRGQVTPVTSRRGLSG
jgi:hypothetical protein